jgi:hypothetical protein
VHVAGVVTANVNVVVTLAPPLSNPLTVTVYVPAGCALVTRTSPVAGSPSRLPLKLVELETLMLEVLVGRESGVTVMSVLNGNVVSG